MNTDNQDKLHFLSAWWCDILVLESAGHFAMIDTGNAGDCERIAAFLRQHGVRELDFILITHFHNDHYGALVGLLEQFSVKTVYMKPYSNVENVGGGGGDVSDRERAAEWEKYQALRKAIKAHSSLVMIYPEMLPLLLGHMTLTIFNADNILQKLYYDPESDYCGRHEFNENNNSAVIYLECANGSCAFLAADAYDEPLTYEPGRYVLTRAAKAIGHKVDLYKLSHHGCGDFVTEQAARILCPDWGVVTNDPDSMRKDERFFSSPDRLKAVNPSFELVCTVGYNYTFNMNGAGKVTLSKNTEILPET